MMGLTSYISCISDAFYFYQFPFSSMAILKMIGLGLGHLVCALSHPPLEILLVVSVAEYLEFFI